jgi:hypothetical protein
VNEHLSLYDRRLERTVVDGRAAFAEAFSNHIVRAIKARDREISDAMRRAAITIDGLPLWLEERGHGLYFADTGDGHVVACKCGEVPGNYQAAEDHIIRVLNGNAEEHQ